MGIKSKKKTMSNRKTSKLTKRASKSIRSQKYEDKHLNNLHKLTGIDFQRGSELFAKVETLTSQDIHQLDGNYAIVDKADGLRYTLYLGSDKVIRILSEQSLIETPIKYKGNAKTLLESVLDTEYIAKTNTYYIFDIIVFNGEDVRNKTFRERYKLLMKFNDLTWDSDKYTITTKNYQIDYTDFHKTCQKVYQHKYPYQLDGIIFTPYNGDYHTKSLKWKPLKDLTIDFIVRIRKKYVDKGKTYLILDLYNITMRYLMKRDGLRFPKGYFDYFPMIDNTYSSVPYPFMPEYDSKHSYCIIEVSESKDKKHSISYSLMEEESEISQMKEEPTYYYRKIEHENNRRIIKMIPIMDNTIMEMNYDTFSRDNNPARKWIPYRFRKDRTGLYWTTLYHNEKRNNRILTGANSKSRADTIWKMFQNPITSDMMFGKKPLPKLYYIQNDIDRSNTRGMVMFHLYIKELLYSTYFNHKNYTENLLELSAGDGSDAANIVQQQPRYVLMIDIVETSLTKAGIDFKKFKNKFRNYHSQFDTLALDLREESVKKIAPYAKKNNIDKFDIVSIQFSFHYMMETKESFMNLFKTIKTYTKPGGYYFMSCFDGATVYKMLKKQREQIITVEGQPDKILFKIEQMYANDVEFDDLPMFGTPINVFIYSIGGHIEYIVNFKKLVSYFKKNGFDLIDTKMFSKLAPEWEKTNKDRRKLTQPEKDFSFLNRYAVFQRQS